MMRFGLRVDAVPSRWPAAALRRCFSAGCIVLAALLTACSPSASAPAGEIMAPRFEVDPLWPRPLPNHWIIGSTVGVAVDSRDHVWIIHTRSSLNDREAKAGVLTPPGECCTPAPPVLEFDGQGNLVGFWGGPGEGFDWPTTNHGIAVDHLDNVWIGGNGQDDAHILKFTRGGQFLLQIGKPGANAGSSDLANFGRVAKVAFDSGANEAYVADGYLNKRVAVLDMTAGTVKRYWGAYGNAPDDADLGPYDPDAPLAAQFRNPVHCAEPTLDGLVYVCDRVNDRIQVFRKDGTFVSELRVAPRTRGGGSVWDIAFSRDAAQQFIFLADGGNERVWIIDRKTMTILTSFGDGGRQPGQFFGVHSIAADSSGNVYTTETFEGKRVQKFINRGLAPVSSDYVGVVWPKPGRD
jgi:DNA-binding beta-propeller fold protein YncE